MERRDFIKKTGKVLIASSGFTMIGLTNSCNTDEEMEDPQLDSCYYNYSIYIDGYFQDGYYLLEEYYSDGYYLNGQYFEDGYYECP